MKKIALVLSLVMAFSFVLAGCNKTPDVVDEAASIVDEASEAIDALEGLETSEAPVEVDKDGNIVEEETNPETPLVEAESVASRVAGMIENQYADLEISAAILKRMAILPGSSFEVEVKITNKGTTPIGFVRGSGVSVVPSALMVDSKDLQYVPPVEMLGAMTMDFQTDVLNAGETKNYTLYFIAAEVDPNFDQIAFDYKSETGDYIADKNPEEIKAGVPGLKEVAAGSYNIDIYLTYSILETVENQSPIMESTGYNKVTLPVSIG